jgi:hypothetical protein
MEVYGRRLVVSDGSVRWIAELRWFFLDGMGVAVRAWIPKTISIMPPKLFNHLRCLHSILFESFSRLTRFGSSAFSRSSLQSIVIPRSVEVLCSKCFLFC